MHVRHGARFPVRTEGKETENCIRVSQSKVEVHEVLEIKIIINIFIASSDYCRCSGAEIKEEART